MSPDYEPNFEFGRRKLGSAGPKFDSKKGRDDIMTKKSDILLKNILNLIFYSRSQKIKFKDQQRTLSQIYITIIYAKLTYINQNRHYSFILKNVRNKQFQ